MDNYILKTLAYNKQVRILFADNTKMTKEICNHKKINKILKTALGRTISIASLITGTLKGNQRISIKVSTSNRNYKIFADADSIGNVRGYINDELLNAFSDNKTNSPSIEQLIGDKGCIQVLKDLGMSNIFTGITDMPYRNITDDFSYYYRQSEQIPTLFSTVMLYNEDNEVVLSRSIMAQLLPGAPDYLMDTISAAIAEIQPILSALEENKAFEEIPYLLCDNIQIIGVNPVQFFCGCSKEFFYPMLYSLKKEELVDAFEHDMPIETVCSVCGRKYSFSPNEIRSFI